MANYLVRVRLPDRPGALGAVASRIGAVGGDVVDIDILQRDGGVVVDELGVVLTGDDLVDLLRDEILEVDGVTVEALRTVDGPLPDRNAEILEFATDLSGMASPTEVLGFLTTRARAVCCGLYAAAMGAPVPSGSADVGDGDRHPVVPMAWEGSLPPGDVLEALARSGGDCGDQVAIARLDRADVVMVVGRAELVFRTRERRRLQTMAELADNRWSELGARSAG